jgi:hypothetical protein
VNTDEGPAAREPQAPAFDESNAEDGDLAEGWYLMSTEDLERELIRRRSPEVQTGTSRAVRLTVPEALAYRDDGNLPDGYGRTLRLLLRASTPDEVKQLSTRRLLFEPDYLEGPSWRKEGSKPVNVVPLIGETSASEHGPWWEEPDLAALESEWCATGAVDGVRVPADYRGFVYKTILALRGSGRAVTVDRIIGSLTRWLGPREIAEIRSALERENRTET